MSFQHILYIYYFFTLSFTSYYFYGLYKIENSIYLFSLNLSNSPFYLSLLYNLIFMIFVLFLNCFIYILFGEITSFLDFIETTNLESKYILQRFISYKGYIKNWTEAIQEYYFPKFLSIYVTLISNMACRKGESFNSGNILDKRNKFYYILLYILVLYINYILYIYITYTYK